MSASSDAPASAALHEAKRALRARVLAARDAITAAAREQASTAITARIAAQPAFTRARVLLLTLPFGSEWDTRPLARAILASRRELLLPRVDQAARMLVLHAVADLEQDVVPGWRGIPEPRADTPRVAPETVDFVLVPGVAFDRQHRRLGYGGGYYDRLLPLLRPHAALVAAAFDEQIVETVPTAPYDRPVGLIVTPTRVIDAAP